MKSSETRTPIASENTFEKTGKEVTSRRAVAVSLVGTAVEYYDFAIYGYFATVLAGVFFVDSDPNAAMLKTLATFAIAYFCRVPGSILFGHIGDKYGRKKALSLTILLMCISTAGIGILPSYATLGIWATLALVLLRCIQGISAGGEAGGAAAYVAEYAPPRHRALYVCSVNVGANFGGLFASLVGIGLTSAFPSDVISDWAWRVPFLLSIPLALVGLWIRLRMEDSPEFLKMAESENIESIPIKAIMKNHKLTMLRLFCLNAMATGGYWASVIYATIFIQQTAGHSAKFAFWSSIIALSFGTLVIPLSAYASDRIGRKKVLLTGALSAVFLTLPGFHFMMSDSTFVGLVSQCLLTVPVSITLGALFAASAEMLPVNVRYTGISLGNNLANMLLGGTASMICVWLIDVTNNSMAPSGFVIFCALLTLGATLSMKKNDRQQLPTSEVENAG